MLTLSVIFSFPLFAQVEINETTFPDPVFRAYVSESVDRDKDGKLSQTECEQVTYIAFSYKELYSLTGIEYFKNLTNITCMYTKLQDVDLSRNVKLTTVQFLGNELKSLDVSGLVELTSLACSRNKLRELDVSTNIKLEDLSCMSNLLKGLDVSKNERLRTYDVSDNRIERLSWGDLQNVSIFSVSNNPLTSVNLSELNLLKTGYLMFDNLGREVELTAENTFDLSQLPDFDVNLASHWQGGTVEGNILTFHQNVVTYRYATQYSGEYNVPAHIRFYLEADLNPVEKPEPEPEPEPTPAPAKVKVPEPVIVTTLKKDTKVALVCPNDTAKIYYGIGEDATPAIEYVDSILISEYTNLSAMAVIPGSDTSEILRAIFFVEEVSDPDPDPDPDPVQIEVADILSVSVYPNPSQGDFSVKIPQDAQVEIFDASGRTIFRKYKPVGTHSFHVNRSGLYMIKVSADGQQSTHRVVVQ